MEVLIWILSGAALGIVIGILYQSLRLKKQWDRERLEHDRHSVAQPVFEELQRKTEAMEQEHRQLAGQLATLEAEKKHLQQKIGELETEKSDLIQKLEKDFEVLANRLLEAKSKKFTEINEEKLKTLLGPLREQITKFENQVRYSHTEETKQRESLRKEIESIARQNKQLSEEADKLTRALKGDKKTQGDWGEMQLEKILERAGLTKGVHFEAQISARHEDGSLLRPDYAVFLPEDKCIIVDSKVSLVDYEKFFHEEDEQLRQVHLKAHVTRIREHIRSLADKNYQQLHNINQPDYVIMFVPIEPALFVALNQDPGLFEWAMERNIVMVSVSTLLATLRTVAFFWKQENQKQHVQEIATQSGKLYDKFVGFLDDMTKVGRQLESAKGSYSDAMNKLTESPRKGDTIIGRMEKIKELGANAGKQIPESFIKRVDS